MIVRASLAVLAPAVKMRGVQPAANMALSYIAFLLSFVSGHQKVREVT